MVAEGGVDGVVLLLLMLPPSSPSTALHLGGSRARSLHYQRQAGAAAEVAVPTPLDNFIHATAADHRLHTEAEEEAAGLHLVINITQQMTPHFLHINGQARRENGVLDAEWQDTLQNNAGMDKAHTSNYLRKKHVKTQVPLLMTAM